MLIEQALMTFLLAQSTIIAYTGQRIYLVQAPQNTIQPYLVINKISTVRIHSHEGGDGQARARFQLTVFASKYANCKGCLSALQTALQGYTGTMGGAGGVAVNGAFYDDETDLDAGEEGLYGVAADYIIQHSE